MSYDLYFTGQRVPKAEFINYFQGRRCYEVHDSQAWYENKDTGVYFAFDYVDENELDEDADSIPYFISFNQNYYRPHFFALEAEPELTAFAQKFGTSVYDPQSEGMDDGQYSPEGFLRGWNRGNKSAYSIMLDLGLEQTPKTIYTLPTVELEEIWNWNYSLDLIYDGLDIDLFVPRIMFALVDGSLNTMCIWPSEVATLIPSTDLVLISRNDDTNGTNDRCLIKGSTLDEILPDLDSSFPVTARNPGTESLPENIHDFVRNLHPDNREISLLPSERVLNAEYVSDCQLRSSKSVRQE